jgi:serine/threonine protein kinase
MTQGLRIMHAHGYVHRDISTGNIIYHDGHGKIADLEYAKDVGTGKGHESRTVCLSFLRANTRSTYVNG